MAPCSPVQRGECQKLFQREWQRFFENCHPVRTTVGVWWSRCVLFFQLLFAAAWIAHRPFWHIHSESTAPFIAQKLDGVMENTQMKDLKASRKRDSRRYLVVLEKSSISPSQGLHMRKFQWAHVFAAINLTKVAQSMEWTAKGLYSICAGWSHETHNVGARSLENSQWKMTKADWPMALWEW